LIPALIVVDLGAYNFDVSENFRLERAVSDIINHPGNILIIIIIKEFCGAL